MEFDDLPQIDPNVDYNAILPIHQKRTIAFTNHFILNTVSFLNNFAESCESRLMQFEYKLQKVEASLLILESQLNSIPDLEVSNSNPILEEAKCTIQALDLPEIINEDEVEEEQIDNVIINVSEGPIASKDSRFVKFFKMVQVGVPPQAVKLKMASEGIDSSILDKPNEVIPGYIEETNEN